MMLKIKRVRSYDVPRYPARKFEPWKQPAGVAMFKRGVSSAALLLLIDSCITGCMKGVPNWEYVTEGDARAAINRVFADNGIQLTADVPLDVVLSPEDTVRVVLDGYNDSLRVGYECVTEGDRESFNVKVWRHLDSDAADAGPYVNILWGANELNAIVQITQDFIDSLKAQGAI
jgi:hypothetical protein